MDSRENEAGSTLIEVAIAMATIAVLAFGVLLGFTTASSQDRQSYEFTRAQNACTATIETIEAMPYELLFQYAGPQLPYTFGEWDLTIQITQVQNDLLALSVTAVSNADGSNQVSLVTLKTMKEEQN